MDVQELGTLSERPMAFLTALKAASEDEGFATQVKATLVVGERWQTTLTLQGPLGSFTCTLWTSWAMLEYDGDVCRLELALGEKELLPVYRCTGVDGFRKELEYLRLIVEQTTEMKGFATALKCGADPTWCATQRDGFIAILKHRTELGYKKTVGSA